MAVSGCSRSTPRLCSRRSHATGRVPYADRYLERGQCGRDFNDSITLSIIDEISCAHVGIRACIMQSPRDLDVVHKDGRILRKSSPAQSLVSVCVAVASAPSQPAFASKTGIRNRKAPARSAATERAAGKRYHFFRHLSENRRRRMRVGRKQCRKSGRRTVKKLKHAAIARIAGRPAKPSPKLSRQQPPRFGRDRRDRAQARRGGSRDRRSAKIPRAAARGDRHPAAGHRVPRRRRTLHPLEQEICRDLQPQLGPVRAGRAAAGHDPHRRRARRLSRSDRPRGRVDRRAAREALSARRAPRADAERRPLSS